MGSLCTRRDECSSTDDLDGRCIVLAVLKKTSIGELTAIAPLQRVGIKFRNVLMLALDCRRLFKSRRARCWLHVALRYHMLMHCLAFHRTVARRRPFACWYLRVRYVRLFQFIAGDDYSSSYSDSNGFWIGGESSESDYRSRYSGDIVWFLVPPLRVLVSISLCTFFTLDCRGLFNHVEQRCWLHVPLSSDTDSDSD